MKTLILSSSFDFTDEKGKIKKLSNKNGFLECLKENLITRKCCVVISGNPRKVRNYDPLATMKKCFEISGISFEDYIYVDDSNKSKIKDYVKKADFIDLCGGHLPMCNSFINELKLKELLKDYNGVVFGASGGAMNMAEKVYCIPEIEGEHNDPKFMRWLKGLGLTDINIIPHFNIFKKKVFSDGSEMLQQILLQDSKEKPFIALPDGSFLIINDTKVEFFGNAFSLNNGKVSKIKQKI